MKKFIYILMICVACAACIEDGYTTSPSDQPTFSTDTLDIGTVFTDEPTPTKRFLVHNPHSKQLSISDISLSGDAADCFRLNVDGITGRRFSNVDIRGKDSIFVLVEATLPQGATPLTEFEASIDFTTNGRTQSVILAAKGQNVHRIKGDIITENTTFDDFLPYQVFDSLVVAPGATLTLTPGTTLCFHDKASLIIRGTLVSEGNVEKPVTLAGDRTGNVVTDISFDIMSRQWTGVFFTATSTGNRLSHTNIRNTWQGVTIEGDPTAGSDTPQLTIHNSKLRNSGGLVLEAYHSNIVATGSEFAEAADGLVYLQGGRYTFNHCTFANYYLFSALGGPAIQFAHVSDDSDTGLDDLSGYPFTAAEFTNSIIYGNGTELSHGDLSGTDIYFRRCLLKSAGEDDDNFIECLWDSDPLYYTVREEYIFDYRLKPESPAIGAADPLLTLPEAATDIYGLHRTDPAEIGAYVFTPPTEEE